VKQGKLFLTDKIGRTLLVVPLANISSLAGEHVQPELNTVLAELEEGGAKNVVIDLERLDYFGSVMLAAMHMMWKRVRENDGRMVLCGVSELGKEVLQIARFDTLWTICGRREEALISAAGE